MRSGLAGSVEIVSVGPEHVPYILPLVRRHARFEGADTSCTEQSLQAAWRGPSPQLQGWMAVTAAGAVIGYATATETFRLDLDDPFFISTASSSRMAVAGRPLGIAYSLP